MDKEKELKNLFLNDPYELLVNKVSSSGVMTADERLVSSFLEINEFYKKNKREPEPNIKDISEHQLYFRLKGLRSDNEKMMSLKDKDEFGLLDVKTQPVSTLDDILSGDSLGILDSDPEDIFNLKHVKSFAERRNADYVAKRKNCKDFDKYEDLFKQVHADIVTNQRKIISFDEKKNLSAGNFYVLNGVMLYLEKIDISDKKVDLPSGDRIRAEGRTRCIFENGTESDMLYRSLVKALNLNGRSITKNEQQVEKIFEEDVNEEDVASGFIYILKSKSENDEIRSINNLYKIGYSNIEVADRIKNAENEPTYLMAPVSVITYFECYNINPQKLEKLTHQFFGDSCLNLDVFDNDGKRHSPREWFIAPLEVIENAVQLIVNGGIINYVYDSSLERIALK